MIPWRKCSGNLFKNNLFLKFCNCIDTNAPKNTKIQLNPIQKCQHLAIQSNDKMNYNSKVVNKEYVFQENTFSLFLLQNVPVK